MKMKPVLFTLCVSVLLIATFAVADDAVTEVFDRTYQVSENCRVSLDNINGDVVVETWDAAEVRVLAEKRASTHEFLDKLIINVNASADAVRIETDYPNSSGRNARLKVEYTLTVPRGARIDSIDLVNGNVTISHVQGGVEAESVNGDIMVRNVGGRIDLSTVNGSIEPELDSLDGVDSITLDSVNGTVELALPSYASADIDADTVNGKISNDFGLTVHKGKYVGSDMRGAIGGGGIAIEIETVNGGIRVTSR